MSHGLAQVHNLSAAKDTVTLERLLREMPEEMDVGHAGTAMRFLTAFLSFQPRDFILTGSSRMQERPIGPLVDALRQAGAEINFMRRDGYPPMMIHGRNSTFGATTIDIPADISSQYISALLMLAPTLPDGLTIRLHGEISSRPYIAMTLRIMAHFGVSATWEGNNISVPRQPYDAGNYHVEADWSAASYWFCLTALSDEAEIQLPGLRPASWQGDQAVVEMMTALGVETTWTEDGVVLRKVVTALPDEVRWDFADCPDLAQGLLVALSALGVAGHFRGLHSLRIKETDRIAALQNELGKFGMQLTEGEDASGLFWELSGTFQPKAVSIPTYQDHRMAMAFAPLALRVEGLQIEAPSVVVKSYPTYWEDLKCIGIESKQFKT
ncbi:UNVERIFIED_CONTAM: hypothetical protein GTU68_057251 [Idotea baltica]|nr:hypothetical protein [Idotea baltica]